MLKIFPVFKKLIQHRFFFKKIIPHLKYLGQISSCIDFIIKIFLHLIAVLNITDFYDGQNILGINFNQFIKRTYYSRKPEA